jgi:8-amino-7-oxononanoate synthase
MSDLLNNINETLQKRKEENLFRQLFIDSAGADFISNDYLGFSRLIHVHDDTDLNHSPSASRLLGGNTKSIEELESHIAGFHGFESSLYFNSGYNANTGLFSCLLSRHDTYIFDELIHASVRDGIRQSLAANFSFNHNDVADLEEKLKIAKGNVVVAVESVYSMDGDMAPLIKIAELCKKYKAELIVDEAHSIGVFGKEGRGLVHELDLTRDVFAVVYTYGKAMGCHGGAVVCKRSLRDFLINYSRPFIYTTAPSANQVSAVKTAYSLLTSPIHEKNTLSLRKNILFFVESMVAQSNKQDVIHSHINKFIIGDNEKAIVVAQYLRDKGFICRPVLSPTVPKGTERIRINLHSFNTLDEITGLIQTFKTLLK